jgi:hypothetical protein
MTEPAEKIYLEMERLLNTMIKLFEAQKKAEERARAVQEAFGKKTNTAATAKKRQEIEESVNKLKQLRFHAENLKNEVLNVAKPAIAAGATKVLAKQLEETARVENVPKETVQEQIAILHQKREAIQRELNEIDKRLGVEPNVEQKAKIDLQATEQKAVPSQAANAESVQESADKKFGGRIRDMEQSLANKLAALDDDSYMDAEEIRRAQALLKELRKAIETGEQRIDLRRGEPIAADYDLRQEIDEERELRWGAAAILAPLFQDGIAMGLDIQYDGQLAIEERWEKNEEFRKKLEENRRVRQVEANVASAMPDLYKDFLREHSCLNMQLKEANNEIIAEVIQNKIGAIQRRIETINNMVENLSPGRCADQEVNLWSNRLDSYKYYVIEATNLQKSINSNVRDEFGYQHEELHWVTQYLDAYEALLSEEQKLKNSPELLSIVEKELDNLTQLAFEEHAKQEHKDHLREQLSDIEDQLDRDYEDPSENYQVAADRLEGIELDQCRIDDLLNKELREAVENVDSTLTQVRFSGRSEEISNSNDIGYSC